MDLAKLAEFGAIGVALAAIGSQIYLLKIVLKIVGNHINHATEATKDQTEVMSSLKTLIENKLK